MPKKPSSKSKPGPKPRVEDLRAEERFPERIPVALHVQAACRLNLTGNWNPGSLSGCPNLATVSLSGCEPSAQGNRARLGLRW